MIRLLLSSKSDNTIEILLDDEVVWQGYIEDADTLEEILVAIGFDVDRAHFTNDENVDVPDEPEYIDPYGST